MKLASLKTRNKSRNIVDKGNAIKMLLLFVWTDRGVELTREKQLYGQINLNTSTFQVIEVLQTL